MRKITQAELDQIILDHELWVNNEGGKRADLYGANLEGANLYDAYLSHTYLRGADLEGAEVNSKTKGLPEWALDQVVFVD